MTARSPAWLLVLTPVATACGASSPPRQPGLQTYALSVSATDTTFVTRDHFIAGVEMQVSGEPFAEAMGRDLGGYSRDFACQLGVCSPSVYFDPATGDPMMDLPGFASAVESYEYSKQAMNDVAFESGAGTSLAFGPLINPAGATGADATQALRSWVQRAAIGANAVSRFVSADATPANPLGWPGFWPTLQPYARWNPAIAASDASTGCSISSDDDPGASGALLCDDYECDYTTLHLPDRAAQLLSPTIDPGSSGWAGWKEALWTLNYLQVMHDGQENAIASVPADQLANVGTAGNTVLGTGDGGGPAVAGTYLGSSDIEGFQAATFLQILDNQAEQWLTALTTTDGATLSGFASLADALAYGDGAPLRWFPASIAVTEAADASGFPRPTAYAIASPDSHLLDLAGLLGAYASIYALTDRANAEVGGGQPALAYFDGDPFPAQNQLPTGAPTLHDRALAMMRVLVADIDRLHVDPVTGAFSDDVTMMGAAPARGAALSAAAAAYTLLALRTARRSLDAVLTLYSNTRPDAAGIPSPLDGFGPVGGTTFGARLDQLIAALAAVFMDHLSTPAGVAYGGWSWAAGAPTDAGDTLDGHTAAIRGLLLGYLSTGDTRYRDRALAVFDRLEAQLYDPDARVYRSKVGDRSNQVTFTPRRFGLLQAALRDTFELIALLPGHADLQALIQDRVGRLDKLVLNGWDDRDQDELVEWPSECAHLGTGPDGQPLGLGGLQMAERVLTGESGSLADTAQSSGGARVITTDREHDCVPEISAAGLPAALADSVTFTLTPWSIGRDEGRIVP